MEQLASNLSIPAIGILPDRDSDKVVQVEALRRKKSNSQLYGNPKVKTALYKLPAGCLVGTFMPFLCWTCCLVSPWGQRQRDISPLRLLSLQFCTIQSTEAGQREESIYRLVFWNSYPNSNRYYFLPLINPSWGNSFFSLLLNYCFAIVNVKTWDLKAIINVKKKTSKWY